MTDRSPDMARLTVGLLTKSAKIRTLGKAGFSRSEIANFLQIRYQHVRNVLVEDERLRERQSPVPEAAGMAESGRSFGHDEPPSGTSARRVTVGANGSVTLPGDIFRAAGVRPGDALLVRFEDEEIKLVTPEATMRKVQAAVRQHVPEGVSLVNELLKERRREVADEQGHA